MSIDTNFLVSPFRYRDGIKIEQENERPSTSYKDIYRLKQQGLIHEIDIEILKVLYEFRYLNKHNIATFIRNKDDVKEITRHGNFKKRMNFLVKNGIVLRHYMYWTEKEIFKRTPPIYSLSRGGAAYIKKKSGLSFSIDKYMIMENVDLILHRLAFNQVASNFISRTNSLKDYKFDIPLKSKTYKTDFKLWGVLDFIYKDKDIKLIIEPVRRNISWDNMLFNRLSLIKDYQIYSTASGKGIFKIPPIIVLVCEDDKHIAECHKKVTSDNSFKNLIVLYTTDVRMMRDKLSDSLMSYVKDKDTWLFRRHEIEFLK